MLGMFWRVEMLLTYPNSMRSNRYLFNPITGNLIQNTSTNRKSVIKQIQKFRDKQLYNDKILIDPKKINKILAKKGRPDLMVSETEVDRFNEGLRWFSVAQAYKKKGRITKDDADLIEKEIEKLTGLDWERDSIGGGGGGGRFFAGIRKEKTPNQEVALIACSKSKSFEKLPKELRFASQIPTIGRSEYGLEAMFAYNSPLFQKSLTWAENRMLPVEIMSAKNGLVKVGEEIIDYDLSLNDVSKTQKQKWAQSIAEELSENKVKKVNILGGKNYVQPLRKILERKGIEVAEPLKGLGVGERLSYLTFDEKTFEQLNVEKNTKKARKIVLSNLEDYATLSSKGGYDSPRLRTRRGIFSKTKERDPFYGVIGDKYTKDEFKGE